MVELDCHLELPVPIDELQIEPDYPNLIRALEQCEFKSLLQEVRDEAARVGNSEQGTSYSPARGRFRDADNPVCIEYCLCHAT